MIDKHEHNNINFIYCQHRCIRILTIDERVESHTMCRCTTLFKRRWYFYNLRERSVASKGKASLEARRFLVAESPGSGFSNVRAA